MSMVEKKAIAPAVGGKHPFDYYAREGMALRPGPEAAAVSDLWLTEAHTKMLSPWVPVHSPPAQTRLTRLFDDHRWQGDELMDAVVLAFRRIGMAQGRRLMSQALDQGIGSVDDPPRELVDLFEQLDNPPDWFDSSVWERGRRRWINCSLSGKLNMLFSDAMGTFVGSEVSSATGQTGRFVNGWWRRELETLTWFRDVTLPGGVDRRSPVFKSIVHVRLMHAQARLALRRTWGDEHFARHGNPISNSMTMGAAVTFALLPPLLDHAYGRRISATDLDAVMLYWAYIAHLMGVAEEIIPGNATEGLEMAHYMVMTAGGPTKWTDLMVNAACDNVLSENAVVRRLQITATAPIIGLVAVHTGESLVRALLQTSPLATVRLQPWQNIAAGMVRLNVLVRRLDDHLPLAERRTERRARHGETSYRPLVALSAKLAARTGVSGTPYDHHDTSVDPPAARNPVPPPGPPPRRGSSRV